jgi:hypothetical protein
MEYQHFWWTQLAVEPQTTVDDADLVSSKLEIIKSVE